jgi:hypothetical protein
MGLEADCTVRLGRKTSAGKALLESERLIFRGEFRFDVPFAEMKSVTVDGGDLVVKTADSEARLELGETLAARWLRLIKEPKSLFEKLEVGPDARVAVVDVNDSLFLTALRERTASVVEARVPEGAPIVFFGAETREALRKLPLLRARMAETGTLWVVRPKASRSIAESEVLEAIRLAGFVDTKVVAFSKTHTAHKAVVPLELRGAPRRPQFVTIPPPPSSAPLVGSSGAPSSATMRAVTSTPMGAGMRAATGSPSSAGMRAASGAPSSAGMRAASGAPSSGGMRAASGSPSSGGMRGAKAAPKSAKGPAAKKASEKAPEKASAKAKKR